MQRSSELMDEYLIRAERKLLAHHSARLTKWTTEQELTLQRAGQLDASAIQNRFAAIETSLRHIKDDGQGYAAQRDEARASAGESRGHREAKFHAELRELGDTRAEEAEETARIHSANLRKQNDEWEERAW